ncbi:B12-binding domain-containing radical SAM protein [Candidatus Omnitrophota bacterium]
MHIVLINPPQLQKNLRSTFGRTKGCILPYNLVSLGTYLKQNAVKVDVIDCVAERISMEGLIKILKERSYDLAGITGFTYTMPQAYKVAKAIKKNSSKTVVVFGGIHASILPERILDECEECDYVVIGEGEKVLLSLINTLQDKNDIFNVPNIAYRKNGVACMSQRQPMSVDVDELPLPDYSLINMDHYVPHPGNYKVLPTFSFYASRGCPFLCAFCSANIVMGKKVRYKSVDRAIDEIKVLINDYNAKGLIFQDSTFTINRTWVKEFCQRMIDEKINVVWRANTRADCLDRETLHLMKEAGCYRVNIGFESGNQETLDFLQKGTTIKQNLEAVKMLEEIDLELGASFILGLPNENMSHVLKTIEFAERVGARFTQFYLPVPYPGTVLRQLCEAGVRQNAAWHDYSSRDFSRAVYLNPNFSEEVYKKLPAFAYKRYYCNFRSIKRILTAVKSFDEFKDCLRLLRQVFITWLKPVRL